MKIKKIEINNFRGFDNFTIVDFSGNFTIIGKNDCGKTNLCYAIRKALDPEIRRVPFNEADSTNSNKDNISIKIVLDVSSISAENRSKLNTFIDRDKTITIELIAEYDKDSAFYNEHLIFGSKDRSKKIPTNISNSLDKVLDVIYVNPGYDIDKDKNIFFAYRGKKDKEDEKGLTFKVEERVKDLNKAISEEEVVSLINKQLNENEEFNKIFDSIKFKTSSNINTSNIYKSLEIQPFNDVNENLNNIGDGKNKTLSLLLKMLSKNPEKEKILICEEPENHLYPQLQRSYSHLALSLNVGQFIITTHSAHIIDFNKMKKIIKMTRNNNIVSTVSANINGELFDSFGHYFNEDVSQSLFYDTVMLVEGFTEKYFYNRLMIDDSFFRDFCTKQNLGVFAIGGIDFSPYKKFLESLGIRVIIKTDNDIFAVPKSTPKKLRYAGIERVIGCLDKNGLKKLCLLLDVNDIDNETFRFLESQPYPINDKLMEHITKLFVEYDVFLSPHKDGFEKEFLEFVNDEVDPIELDYLKKSKLKNLHSYIVDNNLSLRINENNRNSILVRFLYV